MRAAIDRAREGAAGAVLLGGEAGIGKTAVVRHVLDAVAAEPGGGGDALLVLHGSCLPLTSFAVPLVPIRAALATLPAGLPPAPELLDHDHPVTTAPLVLDAWLDRVCELRTVVLSVDDLHWADQSSLDTLLYLLAGRPDRRLAVLFTLRSTELGPGHPVHSWLATMRRSPSFESLALAPLTRPETLEQLTGLLGSPPHETLVGDVYARSQGNPYLNQLLVTDLTASAQHLAPTMSVDLQGALMANWHGLDPAARELTSVVAVAGFRMGAGELQQIVGPRAAGVATALTAAVAGHVLDRAADGSYWFPHPLQAEALREYLPWDERRKWHEIVAAHLERRLGNEPPTATLVQIADHHHGAGHRTLARDSAIRAATAAAGAGAHPEAIRLLCRALDLGRAGASTGGPARTTSGGAGWTEGGAGRTERSVGSAGGPASSTEGTTGSTDAGRADHLRVLRSLRQLAADAGNPRTELAAVQELMSLLEPSAGADRNDVAGLAERLELAEMTVRRSLLRLLVAERQGEPAEVARAVELAEVDPASWQYAYALAERARVAAWEGDPALPALAAAALAAARRCGHPKALSFALTAQAMSICLHEPDRHAEAASIARAARAAALDAHDFWAFVHAVAWEGNSQANCYSLQTVAASRSARSEAIAHGAHGLALSLLGANEAGASLVVGDWTATRDVLRTLFGSGLEPICELRARVTAARLSALQGRMTEAVAHLDRCEELSKGLDKLPSLESETVWIEVPLLGGDVDLALRRAEGVLDLDPAPHMCEWLLPLVARALADRACAARDGGAPDPVAEDTLRRLERDHPEVIYSGTVMPDYQTLLDAFGAWYAAELARGLSRPTAAAAWQDAAQRLEAVSLLWEATYAWYRVGEAALQGEHPDRHVAARALRTAAGMGGRLQAAPVLDRVERLARSARISLRSPADHPSRGLSSLTRRENEILVHLVAGRTYREIADALVLSEKTVSSHISNMLRKTGAANRVDLARRAGDAAP